MREVLLPTLGTGLLAALTIGLGLAVSRAPFEVPLEGEAGTTAVTATGNGGTNTLNLPAPRPAVFYEAVTDRPLFAPGRRPEQQQPEVPAPVEAPAVIDTPTEPEPVQPADLQLHGTLDDGRTGRALVSIGGEPATWLQQGDSIAGWTIATIGPDWIDLEQDSRKTRIDLYPK